MTTPEYRKGRAFEHVIVHAAEDAGLLVVRSAGSKGRHGADVMAFGAHGSFAISCKVGTWPSPAERRAMMAWHNVCDVSPWMVRKNGSQQWWRELRDDGSMGVLIALAPWVAA